MFSVHISGMSSTKAGNGKSATRLGQPIIMLGFATTIIIAIGAFTLSFASLTDLAGRSGIETSLAWIWPIIVDGLIVASTVAIIALSGHGRRVLAYPWALLFFGAIVSTSANAVHAIIAVDQAQSGVPAVVSAVVASMPPIVLLAITHLTVILVQKSAPKQPSRKTKVPRPKEATTPAPVREPAPALAPVRSSSQPAAA